MKIITFCLFVSLIPIVSTQGLAQSSSQSKKERRPKGYAALEFFGTHLKVTLTSGQTTEGKLIGWQNDYTEAIRKGGILRMTGVDSQQTGEAYLELEQKNISRKIPFSEITKVTARRNFFQKVGFNKVGQGLAVGLLSIILGIDWIIHGGKVDWDL